MDRPEAVVASWLLAPDGIDEGAARAARGLSDEALRLALSEPRLKDERLGAAVWLEALRRRLDLPPIPDFSERLPEWPERSLTEALGPYLRDYDLPRRAALLAEAARRGLDPTARPPEPPSACLVAVVAVLAVFCLAAAVLSSIATKVVGGPVAVVAGALVLAAATWVARTYVRPWLQRARYD